MRHPAIVVDLSRKNLDQPRRVPLVLGAQLSITDDGLSLLPGSSRGSVSPIGDGTVRVSTHRGEEVLEPGAEFRVHRRRFLLSPLVDAEELLVDVRRIGAFIAWNAFHAEGPETRWRGFRADDSERALVDVHAIGDVARGIPPTAGIAIEWIVDATEAQQARMEPSVAAAIAAPFLDLVEQRTRVSAVDVVVTWDGAVRPRVRQERPRPVNEPIAHAVARAVTTFWRLCGREPADAITAAHVAEVRDTRAAPDDAVAAIVRALFPAPWAIESAVREQAAMLDVDALNP